MTMLSGEDLMDREFIEPKMEEDGETLRLTFPRAAPAGRFFRLELYGVVFPAAGGDMQCTGTYTLEDGSEHDVEGIPAVTVKGVTPFDQFKTFLEEQAWVQAWNSNTFLRLFFNPVLIVSSLPIIFTGFLMSLAIVLGGVSAGDSVRLHLRPHAHLQIKDLARHRRGICKPYPRHAGVPADIHRVLWLALGWYQYP